MNNVKKIFLPSYLVYETTEMLKNIQNHLERTNDGSTHPKHYIADLSAVPYTYTEKCINITPQIVFLYVH